MNNTIINTNNTIITPPPVLESSSGGWIALGVAWGFIFFIGGIWLLSVRRRYIYYIIYILDIDYNYLLF